MKNLLLCLAFAVAFVPNSAPAKRFDSASRITAVNASSITVHLGRGAHTYKISSTTQIHLDGRKVSASELHKGMHADVTVSQLDPTLASAIEAKNTY